MTPLLSKLIIISNHWTNWLVVSVMCDGDGCKNYSIQNWFPQNCFSDLKQEEVLHVEQRGGGRVEGVGGRGVATNESLGFISLCLSIISIVLRTVIGIWWPVGVLLSEVRNPAD